MCPPAVLNVAIASFEFTEAELLFFFCAKVVKIVGTFALAGVQFCFTANPDLNFTGL
jgi:hypothetical protein